MVNKLLILAGILAFTFADTDKAFSYMGYGGTAGEILMVELTGSSMFYWQFNALNGNISTDTRPLIIWTQGGPGCGSELGLFAEGIAPFTIDPTGNPQPNPNTWTLRAHVLAIDFPFDAGFSYASLTPDFQNTTINAVEYLYSFLQKLAVKYPSWFNRDVYWFGEDYSGHFVPAIAGLILHNNNNNSYTPINLKGIALGDPWADGLYQTQYYDIFTYSLGLVNPQQKSVLSNSQQLIQTYIMEGNYSMAFNTWLFAIGQLESYTNNVDIYNMRNYSVDAFSNLNTFLNSASVKSTFGVPRGATWTPCNSVVFNEFATDFMLGFVTTMMPSLLSNLKVMIYHGQDDLYSNTLGLNSWISKLNWQYISNFQQSRRGAWMVQGQIAGFVQTYSNLTYVQVLNAGNQVGASQPVAFRDLAYRFIFNQGWN